jgi:hypothetical protein
VIEDSIFAGMYSRDFLNHLEDIVAAERGGRRFHDPDTGFLSIFCGWIEHCERDPLDQLLLLGRLAQKFADAGRLEEFRGPVLRALAAVGRRAQVELLTSGETS